MYQCILFILSTLALLIHPLSLSAQNNFSVSLDVDGSAGDQAVTSANVSTHEMIAIQIFGKDIQNAYGILVRFEYNASQVTYEGFDAGDVLPNAQALPEQGTNPTFVEIGIASLGGATVNSGLVGTVRFRTTAGFSGTEIRLVRTELSRGGQIASATMDMRVELTLQVLTPDFNRDGMVNFADFLVFGDQYGARQGDGRYEAKYDLDSDGAIGFGDFLIFGNSYGQDVSTPGGSSGDGGSPDLIVESPSASDSILTTGQSFTLQATVRNQGSGQAAATILRYYQSVDAIISLSDTRVGSNAVGSLNASSSSVESINLNAPSSAGTYYYGACVESVSGESNTNNNCSRAVRVTVSSGGSTTNIDIPDANLRAVIADSLDKASGVPITRADMTSLTHLEAQNKVIRDLTGLEFATGLTRLDLSDNLISDISPLADLTNLNVLYLSGNLIPNISPLANLNNLTALKLDDNLISDVSALAGLTSLRELYLYSNEISDLSSLSSLTNLRSLNLYRTSIVDISPLSSLTNLRSLNLGRTSIVDISPLSSLTNLTSLILYRTSIVDISPLSSLTNLTSLILYRTSIVDISPLSSLTNLRSLNLDWTSIVDISPLSSLISLTDLSLNDIDIFDFSPLSGLTNLTGLVLDNNSISDISPLSNLTNLTDLSLLNNSISDISPLSNLTNLTDLNLSVNPIVDLSPLSNLTSLTSLLLFHCAITDLSPLSNLTSLKDLHLDNLLFRNVPFIKNNSITDISALSGLTSLTNLSLGANLITDLAPLVANTGLGRDDWVDVRDNPLSTISLNTHIPALQGRGVDVRFGAGKPAVEDIERGMIPEDWEAREDIYRKWLEEGKEVIILPTKARREER